MGPVRRTPWQRLACAASIAVLIATSPVRAQQLVPVAARAPSLASPTLLPMNRGSAHLARTTSRDVATTRDIGWPAARAIRARAPWWAPLASAALPGAGQAVLGQDRWIAFAAVEGMSWMRYAADRRDARRERRGYQRLANQVARALYSDGAPMPGSFDYYETMEKWLASGVYDAQPGGALDPESDSSTFNGAIWLLARQTYWADPDEPPILESAAYRNAVAFYERRAIRPEFRWSWRDAQLQQDLYRRGIMRSNQAYQRVAQDLAAVLANHVLSTVDAYVTVRLRRRPGVHGGETRLEATLPWPGGPPETGTAGH